MTERDPTCWLNGIGGTVGSSLNMWSQSRACIQRARLSTSLAMGPKDDSTGTRTTQTIGVILTVESQLKVNNNICYYPKLTVCNATSIVLIPFLHFFSSQKSSAPYFLYVCRRYDGGVKKTFINLFSYTCAGWKVERLSLTWLLAPATRGSTSRTEKKRKKKKIVSQYLNQANQVNNSLPQ